MKVIVGGGTGFIGSALVRALLMRGDQVAVLARSEGAVRQRFGPGVQALEWNPPQPGLWMEAFNEADAVVNLAGYPVVKPQEPWTPAVKAKIRNSRVDSTRAFVQAISQAHHRPDVFLNQSAIGYYGSQRDRILTEESLPGNDFLAGVVQEWEAAARPVEDFGVRLVLMRTGIVLDRGRGALAQFELPFKLFLGGTMGAPDQWVSWIHIDDEVDLMIYALTHDQMRGPVNATAPNPVTMDVFSRELGQSLHRPSWVPMVGVGMKLLLGQRAQALLASQRVLPEAAKAAGYLFRHAQSGAALRAIYAPPAVDAPSGL